MIDEAMRKVDKTDYPFVDDPQVVGKWKSVDFVETIDDFIPGEKQLTGDLFLKEMVILEDGKTSKSWWTWTKGMIFHHGDQTASSYVIKEMKNSTYMFFEWKSGDYIFRNMKPWFYVLKKRNGMRKGFIIALSVVTMSLVVALCLISWVPSHSSSPSHVAALEQEEPAGKPKEVDQDLRILFVGDTSFGENYIRKSFFETRGYDYSLKKLAALPLGADMVIANLETPLTDMEKSPFSWKKRYIHWGDVSKVPETLKKHNIQYVSLANNHTLDYGVEGLLQTMLALKENGLVWFGAGLDVSQAAKPLRSNFRVGKHPFNLVVASGFEYRTWYSAAYHYYADENQGGVNGWKGEDTMQQIRDIRQADNDAFIVAFPHSESNYRLKTKRQTKLAHALIEAGSDLVIGHGAHMLQEIEYYQGKWILYGLGNFVFNSPGRYQKENVPPFSLAASLDVVDKEEQLMLTLRLYPIFSDNRITKYRPRFVTEEELNRVRSNLLQHSPDPAHLQRELKTGEDEVGLFLALDVYYQSP